MSIDKLPQSVSRRSVDEDPPKRTGTLWTASADIITMMVGPGVFLRAWDIAQLGWIAGPAVILLFSFVCYYTSLLLSDCYRTSDPRASDPNTGQRNSTYMDSVHSILGGAKAKACGFLQHITLFGNAIWCSVLASISMMAIKYVNCIHETNWEPSCQILSTPYMIMFGITEVLLSQIPDCDHWLSIVATVMFVAYSLIGLGLGIAQVAASGKGRLTVISVGDATETQKIWRCFQALGNIASAYSVSEIIIETQDTIRSPPSEAKTMKKAISLSTVVMTTIYILGGCLGYAAFGDDTPENLLINFSIHKPFWLIDIVNAAIVINLFGAYQVNSQPIFAFVEKQADQRWPNSEFIAKEIKIPVPGLGQFNIKLFRLVWRTAFVILTTVISMVFPFVFNDVVAIISLGFWPLMVYFPVEMYIRQKQIPKWSTKWVCLQMLSMACLVISIMATAGLIPDLKDNLKTNQPFGLIYQRDGPTFG